MVKKKTVKKAKPVRGFKPKTKKVKRQKIKHYDPQEIANMKSGEVVLLNGLDLDNVYIAYPLEGEGMVATNLKHMSYAVKLTDLIKK